MIVLLIILILILFIHTQYVLAKSSIQLKSDGSVYRLFWNKRKINQFEKELIPYISISTFTENNDIKKMKNVDEVCIDLPPLTHVKKDEIGQLTNKELDDILMNSLRRSLLKSQIFSNHDYKVSFSSDGIILISFKSFLGHEVYSLVTDRKIKVNQNENMISFSMDYYTPQLNTLELLKQQQELATSTKKNKKMKLLKSCNIQVSLIMDLKQRTRKLKISTSIIGGLSKKMYHKISKLLSDIIGKQILYESLLGIARFRQSQEYVTQTKEKLKKLQAKQNDMIINPEKYKSPSPTVRKSGGSGSGRYIPSEATQARRIVKKGGG